MSVKCIKAQQINDSIKNNPAEYVRIAEENYRNQLKTMADKIICDRECKPLVLISGPSGSGKTTSALRIAELIKQSGLNVHTISMDNYFLPGEIEKLPRDKNGKIDLESPYRVDIELFSEHLKKLFRCEEIKVPVFDFATQSRPNFIPMTRKENEIIIIEGIHALNPLVTGDTDSFTTCIYVSVRTRIAADDGTVLHPSRIRLMRRLMRDKLFRGRKLEDIFELFASVSRGEELYIMPYKHRANFDIDTFISYEASAYRDLLLPGLEEIRDIMKNNTNYNDIMKFLTELSPLPTEAIPADSLVREFIGGSCLPY
jgi:uridine kinase